MKNKKFDAVEFKQRLQEKAYKKLSQLSEKEQLKLLHKMFGHLMTNKKVIHLSET